MTASINVAFIGLGHMGMPMALNLLKAGYQLKVFDLQSEAMAELKLKGAKDSVDVASAVNDADIVISMLPAGEHVRQLYIGSEGQQQGVIDLVRDDTLLIDCSTIDVQSAQQVAKVASQKGLTFIDAPVSGGTAGASAGTLTFICGGSETGFSRAQVVLQAMGKNIFHGGGPGAGQSGKICNNMLLGVIMAATSEALQLGIDQGLDPKVLSEIMKASSGGNWALEKYNPCPGVMSDVPASNGYRGGFMVDLMVKDLGLSQRAAKETHSKTPLGALAQNLFVSHQQQGNGKRDFSCIFEAFKHSVVNKES